MNRFQRVIEILDRAVGGPNAPVGFHGAVWRNITRNDFVARKIFGLQLVAVGDGAGSNLVKALKGESPFGADLAEPPPDATFSRMPAGLEPVPPSEIAFIETWINEGCLEGDVASAIAPLGEAQPAARAGGRRDAARRLSLVAPRAGRTTIAELMADVAPLQRDLQWLKGALQIAIQLELATLPPYLTAYWTIKDEDHETRTSIHEIWREEMAHFGLACNLLVAIGGTPLLTDAAVVPAYPGPLPAASARD